MKKSGLLVLICMFTLLLEGCAKNVDSLPVEDNSETIFEIPEFSIHDEDDKQQMEYAQKGAVEFDVSVFNEIEEHNLDILARLDTY